MARFSLSTYWIEVTDRYSNEAYRLGDIHGLDLAEVVSDYLDLRQGEPEHDRAGQKLIIVTRCDRNGRVLKGITETGEYGYESDLLDLQSGNVSYRRQRGDAEMLSFFFRIDLPARADYGVVVLQRFHQFGIRRALLGGLVDWFKGQYPDQIMRVNPLVPQRAWEPFLQAGGTVRKVRFIRHSIRRDIASAYDQGARQDIPGEMELVVKTRALSGIPIMRRVRQVVTGRRDVRGLVQVNGFDYDTVKVDVEFQGARRTLDLGDLQALRPYYSIDDQVAIGEDGHPDFESIDRLAAEITRELRREINDGDGG